MKLISKLQLIIGSIITLILLILHFTIGKINIVSSYDVNLCDSAINFSSNPGVIGKGNSNWHIFCAKNASTTTELLPV